MQVRVRKSHDILRSDISRLSSPTIDLFPSPPTHHTIQGPTEKQMLDLLLQKVQTDSLDGMDSLGLTQSAYDKLETISVVKEMDRSS